MPDEYSSDKIAEFERQMLKLIMPIEVYWQVSRQRLGLPPLTQEEIDVLKKRLEESYDD